MIEGGEINRSSVGFAGDRFCSFLVDLQICPQMIESD
jgi:hypothetical protein